MSTLTPFMQRLSIIVKQVEEEARNRAFCDKVFREPKALAVPKVFKEQEEIVKDVKEVEIEWVI